MTFTPHGKHLIAGEWVAGESTFASDPAHGAAHEFSVGTPKLVERACYFAPVVLACCIVGSFAINNSAFGVLTMLVFGLIGWLFEENGIPLAPAILAILAIVLGGMLEFNFVTSMLKSGGDPTIFFSRPVAVALGLIVITIWLFPLARILRTPRASAT